MIAFCDDCGHAIHVPQLICPVCRSAEVTPRAVAGTGTIYTYTVNHQPWLPDMAVPFVLAVVDLDGAPGARVTAPLRDVAPHDVAIGMRVRVGFTAHDDVWLPHWLATAQGVAA